MTESPAPTKRRRKWLWRSLWSMLFLFVGAVGFWCWSYYSALAERDALIAEIRSRGEHVWWDEVVEKLVKEPTEGTGAELYLKAVWELGGETNPKGPRMPSKQLTGELDSEKFKLRVHPLVEKELKLAEPALATLEKAVRLPPGRVIRAIRNPEPVSIILSEVVDIRRLQKMLHWQSFDALAKGDSDRAYHAAWKAMVLSQQLAKEHFVLAQINRMVVLGFALDQLAMCLANASPSDDEWKAIDSLLADLEQRFDFSQTIAVERALWLTTLERPNVFWLATLQSRIQRKAQGAERYLEEWLLDAASSPINRPVRIRAQVEYLQAMVEIAPFLDNPQADMELMNRKAGALEKRAVMNRFTGETDALGIKWLTVLAKRGRTNHQRVTLARLALRLRRHFDQHGRLPDPRESLCDRAMPTIRLEWFNDEPIVYKPSANGFRLELSEACVPAEDRHRLKESPLQADFGLEIEFKPLPAQSGATK